MTFTYINKKESMPFGVFILIKKWGGARYIMLTEVMSALPFARNALGSNRQAYKQLTLLCKLLIAPTEACTYFVT